MERPSAELPDAEPRRASPTSSLLAALLLLVAIYIGSYVLLSRLSYKRADALDLEGYYFVTPTSQRAETLNRRFTFFFYPLVFLDCRLGTGRCPASEPMSGLSLSKPMFEKLAKK